MEPRVLHVNEADAVRDFGALLERVQAGMEVVIETRRATACRHPRGRSSPAHHL